MEILAPIHDGYTLKGTVAASGRFPEVTFEYRPALAEAVADHIAAPKHTGKLAMKAFADLLLRHVLSWSILDRGEPTGVTLDVLNRMPHPILVKMVDIVTGYSLEEQTADAKN